MFTNFIVGTDLSAASYAVVSCLGGLKVFGANKCLLLQCLSLQDATSAAFAYSTDDMDKMLNQQKEILEKQGFEVETRVIMGHAKKEINRIAEMENYSFIVVGSQGHSLVSSLGGVAYGVMSSAKKPVLLIPVRKKDGYENECEPMSSCAFIDHILFPTDFSQTADDAFTYMEKLAADGVRRITLLHIQDQTKIDKHLRDKLEEFNRIDTERLKEIKNKLQSIGVADVKIELPYGSPKQEIIERTKKEDVSMVVMGSQGRGFFGEIFLGSVSHAIVRNSEVPVLLIPAIQ